MKKIIAVILVLVTMLSLVACRSNEVKEPVDAKTDVEITDEKVDVDIEETTENDKTENKEDKTEDKSEDKKDDKQDKPSQTKPEAKPEVKPEAKPEAKPEEKPEVKPEAKPEAKPEEKPADTTPKTAGNTLLADFKAKASSYSNALALAEAVSQNSIIPFSAAAMPVEEGYLAGFDEEIKGFKEGAMFGPVIGSIPFVGYVFILEDGADASAFISTLKKNANLRWNICVEAEEMVSGSVGNKVFFVMTNKSFDEE